MCAVVTRVVLIGLRRSGKSTVGALVGPKMGWALVDTDELVQATTGRSPADWIRSDGIASFRKVESAAVEKVARLERAVIATGGGVPLSQENRDFLRPASLVVYLRADPWILAERARADERASLRPQLAGETPSEEPFILFAERDGVYRSFCDLVVDAARPPDEVAAVVLDALVRR